MICGHVVSGSTLCGSVRLSDAFRRCGGLPLCLLYLCRIANRLRLTDAGTLRPLPCVGVCLPSGRFQRVRRSAVCRACVCRLWLAGAVR